MRWAVRRASALRMSMRRIIAYAMLLGVIVGAFTSVGVGVAVTFVSVIAAGLIQPVPPKRRRRVD